MITNFETYEKVINTGKPELGNYVIIKRVYASKSREYNNIIGKIYAKTSEEYGSLFYYVKCKLPDGHFFNDAFHFYDFLVWSKNKKELENYLQTIKYNV